MEAPQQGISPDELNATIKAHFQEKYRDTNDGLVCKKCGAKVQFVRCDVSVHETAPGGACEGFGETQNFSLPFCPKCEGEPKSKSTCIHVGTHRIEKMLRQ